MPNHFIQVLNNLLNFGVREDEVLSSQERIKIVKSFKDNFHIEDYLSFFNDLEKYILNEKVSYEEKEKVIILLMRLLSSSWRLEDNISMLPVTIITIYNSYISFLNINILFEEINNSEVTYVEELKYILLIYMDFLDNPINESFIQNVFSKIKHFNEILQGYLDSENIYGIKHKNDIDNDDLLLLLGKTFGNLNSSRVY